MKPIAIFGRLDQDLENKIMVLRHELLVKKQIEKSELETIPHLTIAVTWEYPDEAEISYLADHIKDLVSIFSSFNLPVSGIKLLEDNIVAEFENTFSKNLVTHFDEVLQSYSLEEVKVSFKPVVTDYVKLLRKVKPEYLNTALTQVEQLNISELPITSICIAGKMLRTGDILWQHTLDN